MLGLTVVLPGLSAYFETLAVPVLRLPPWCVESPWWLIYVAHEVGHPVQHDLRLEPHFRQGMEQAATAKGLPSEDVARWGRWGEEIFADVFSIMMMGPWAVWSVAEEERSAPPAMIKCKPKYPSPIVRLALMARLADKLALEGSWALHSLAVGNWNALTATDSTTVGSPGMEGVKPFNGLVVSDWSALDTTGRPANGGGQFRSKEERRKTG